jgi:hypothetical protein
MGSTMDSRYWVCPSCFCQFDWEDGSAEAHDADKCRQSQDAAAKPKKTNMKEVYESLRKKANRER